MCDTLASIGRTQLYRLPLFLQKRTALFEVYRSMGIPLLDISRDSTDLTPVRFRAVMRTSHPRKVISALSASGITAIVPTEDRELLGTPELFPNAAHLSRTTVSLPLYPLVSKLLARKIALRSCVS
jgi:perosamine synthetase